MPHFALICSFDKRFSLPDRDHRQPLQVKVYRENRVISDSNFNFRRERANVFRQRNGYQNPSMRRGKYKRRRLNTFSPGNPVAPFNEGYLSDYSCED